MEESIRITVEIGRSLFALIGLAVAQALVLGFLLGANRQNRKQELAEQAKETDDLMKKYEQIGEQGQWTEAKEQ